MDNIVVNNVRYWLPSCMELKVGQAIRIAQIDKQISENIELKMCDCREVIVEVCAIPKRVAGKIGVKDMRLFVQKYAKGVVNELISEIAQRKAEEARGVIKCGGEELLGPEVVQSIDGKAMCLARVTAEEFCDVSDLYVADPIKYAPLIVSILCRPKGERYNSQIARSRVSGVMELRVGEIMGVLAAVRSAHSFLRDEFPHCYKGVASGESRGERLTWYDVMMLAAGYVPSEVKTLEKMNAYDFIAIINSKNKLR